MKEAPSGLILKDLILPLPQGKPCESAGRKAKGACREDGCQPAAKGLKSHRRNEVQYGRTI